MQTKNIVRYLFLAIFAFTACEEDDMEANGTATASFSIENIVEVENATEGLSINVGYDNPAHAGGSVAITINGGTYGEDYITSGDAASFTIDVPASTLLSTFTITPVDDEDVEEDVVLTVTLTNATDALSIGEVASFTYTILDNDNPLVAMVSFEAETQTVEEDDDEDVEVNILFNQATTDGGVLTITGSGDAVYGTDYTIEGQTSENFSLSVPAGATGASFTITGVDDEDFGPDVTATFTITEVSGGLSLGADTVSSVIFTNDDAAPNPVIDFDGANTLTLSEDDGDVTVNFILSEALSTESTVAITATGSADLGVDYTIDNTDTNPYILTIPAGATSAAIVLNISDDTDVEDDDEITLEITSTTGGLDPGVTIQSQTFTVVNNDSNSVAIDYLETFEGNDGTDNVYLEDVLMYQSDEVNQTIDNQRFDLITNGGSFSDADNVGGSSDNGLNFFYNSGGDAANFGDLDSAIITPVLEGTGTIDISFDTSYAFKNQNSGSLTFYWSETYDGSGGFDPADWTILDTESVADMDGEGFGNNDYKRQEFTVTTTANFYIAVRLEQTVDAEFFRTRWRLDNFRAVSQ